MVTGGHTGPAGRAQPCPHHPHDMPLHGRRLRCHVFLQSPPCSPPPHARPLEGLHGGALQVCLPVPVSNKIKDAITKDLIDTSHYYSYPVTRYTARLVRGNTSFSPHWLLTMVLIAEATMKHLLKCHPPGRLSLFKTKYGQVFCSYFHVYEPLTRGFLCEAPQ